MKASGKAANLAATLINRLVVWEGIAAAAVEVMQIKGVPPSQYDDALKSLKLATQTRNEACVALADACGIELHWLANARRELNAMVQK